MRLGSGLNCDVTRSHGAEYDYRRRVTEQSVETDEAGEEFTRTFTYAYTLGQQAATVTRTGPDGVESYMAFDRVNRLT